MEEKINDKDLDLILNGDFTGKDINEVVLNIAKDLKEERKRRKELEIYLKEIEEMLKLMKNLEESKNMLKSIKDDLIPEEMSHKVEDLHHFSVHEKIVSCSIWLLMRAKTRENIDAPPPNMNELREYLLELNTEGRWPGSVVPSSANLKEWHKKYRWEKIFSDYFFNFLMNKGFGVEIDYNEFIPELYKKWEEHISSIDGE